jgi:tRNA threonylcarbamoyladenosine biosynthesis protein TsaE
MHLVSHSADDTRIVAARFARAALAAMPGRTGALVIGLRGELGAGKTTFVQAFAHALGIAEQPKSPTFNLMKSYAVPRTTYVLWHLDCYRLTRHTDLGALDLHARFAEPHNIILVEWPERVSDGLPRDHLTVSFSHTGGDTRSITLPSL